MSQDEQMARATLRLGFLQTVEALSGRPASLVTVEGNVVTASIVGLDRDTEKVAVEQVKTPSGVIKHAIVRLGDLDYIRLDAKKVLKEQ